MQKRPGQVAGLCFGKQPDIKNFVFVRAGTLARTYIAPGKGGVVGQLRSQLQTRGCPVLSRFPTQLATNANARQRNTSGKCYRSFGSLAVGTWGAFFFFFGSSVGFFFCSASKGWGCSIKISCDHTRQITSAASVSEVHTGPNPQLLPVHNHKNSTPGKS